MCHQQKWLFYLSNGLHSTCTKIDEQFKCKCDRVHSIFFSPFRSSFEKESKGESPIGCYTAKISSEFQMKLFDHFFFLVDFVVCERAMPFPFIEHGDDVDSIYHSALFAYTLLEMVKVACRGEYAGIPNRMDSIYLVESWDIQVLRSSLWGCRNEIESNANEFKEGKWN